MAKTTSVQRLWDSREQLSLQPRNLMNWVGYMHRAANFRAISTRCKAALTFTFYT